MTVCRTLCCRFSSLNGLLLVHLHCVRRSGVRCPSVQQRHYASICRATIAESQEAASNRPPRFYVPAPLPAAAGELVELDPEEGRHAAKALRLAEGDAVELCDGGGGLLQGRIAAVGKKGVTVEAAQAPQQTAWRGPKWEVTAGFGLLKGGRADWLVEKAAELGAYSLRPLVSERVHGAGAGWKVDARPSKSQEDSPHGRQARWERVAGAANKQSLRVHGLLVRPQTLLVEYLPQVAVARLALVAVAGAPELLAAPEAVAGLTDLRVNDEVQLIVGPEGDFTLAEVHQLLDAGAIAVGLGPLRLRVETAAVALLAAATAFQRSRHPAVGSDRTN